MNIYDHRLILSEYLWIRRILEKQLTKKIGEWDLFWICSLFNGEKKEGLWTQSEV